MYNGYELAISESELDLIINEKSITYEFNPEKHYNELKKADQIALKHLVKAAKALDDVFLKQDHSKSIEMKKALEKAAAKGDSHAEKALVLFKIFNGIEGNNGISKDPVRLFKSLKLHKSKNIYPEGLTKEELITYLKENIEEAPAILSYDTIVKKEKGQLVALPYSIAFNKEYKCAAKELLMAARQTTHKEFAQYLRYQAQALVSNDPEYAYKADESWANLKDCPLEFTIGRESYEDSLTGAIGEEKEFVALLEENGLSMKSKDFIGVRVGLVDVGSSNEMMDYKNHLKGMSELMPLKEKYKQSVDLARSDDIKQTLADVELVYLSGDYCACRPGITLAQNLPNDDKLSVQLNSGNRNVFHRQIRRTEDIEKRMKLLNSLVDSSLHALYDRESDHLFTIGHELTHSLGPMATATGKDKKVALGDGYGDIIEECKADLGSLNATEYFLDIGKYSQTLVESIYVTWSIDQLPLSEPNITQPHRVRELMQLNYFIEKGALEIQKGSKLSVNLEKILPAAREMLTEVIKIQLEGNADKARIFVDKYRQWNNTMQYISEIKQSLSPKPYKILKMPLAEKLLAE
jgi:hypothetical protein